jgi:cytochrome b6-f complex iron-sulfur subunit
MERKDFIKTCSLVCLSGTALSIFLESCSTTAYFAQSNTSNNQIIVKKSEFSYLKKEQPVQRKFVMIKTERFQLPICIYKHTDENYSALYTECTHKGCEVKPNDNFIVCPCHGSEYTNKGVVQNPPAERNLKQFKITTDNENIYVQL